MRGGGPTKKELRRLGRINHGRNRKSRTLFLERTDSMAFANFMIRPQHEVYAGEYRILLSDPLIELYLEDMILNWERGSLNCIKYCKKRAYKRIERYGPKKLRTFANRIKLHLIDKF